jgi:hypothetical protein
VSSVKNTRGLDIGGKYFVFVKGAWDFYKLIRHQRLDSWKQQWENDPGWHFWKLEGCFTHYPNTSSGLPGSLGGFSSRGELFSLIIRVASARTGMNCKNDHLGERTE